MSADPFDVLAAGIQFPNRAKRQPTVTKEPVFEPPSFFTKRAAKPQDQTQEEPKSASDKACTALLRAKTVMKEAKSGEKAKIEPMLDFGSLDLPDGCLEAVRKLIPASASFVPAPIQRRAIPAVLARRDVLGCAPTGSGKTLAFVLPLLVVLNKVRGVLPKPTCHTALACIVAPTHELATQIAAVVSMLAPRQWRVLCLTAAVPPLAGPPLRYDFVVATPCRLARELGVLSLAEAEFLVLDEVDKLLELALRQQADCILDACLNVKQTRRANVNVLMFSATLASSVEALAISALSTDALRIIVGHKDAATSSVDQRLVFTTNEQGKLGTLQQQLLSGQLQTPILVFVQSVPRACELFSAMQNDPVFAPQTEQGVRGIGVVHAELSKAERNHVMRDFRLGSVWLLIATDVIARGIDMLVSTVINFDLPCTPEGYVHRIGRTGRAGRKGTAITYFTTKDRPFIRSIVNILKVSGYDVPNWMLEIKKPGSRLKREIRKKPPKRQSILQRPKPLAGPKRIKK